MWPFSKNKTSQPGPTVTESTELRRAALSDLAAQTATIVSIASSTTASEIFDRRLDAIIYNITDPVIAFDITQKIVLANPATETLFGIHNAKGQDLALLFPDAMEYAQRLTQSPGAGAFVPCQCEVTGYRANGEAISVEISVTELKRPDNTSLFFGVMRDISAHKKKQKELTDLVNFYHDVLDGMPVCIFMKDRQGRYEFANRMYQNTYGRDHMELVGKTDDEFWTSDVADPAMAEDAHVRETGRKILVERKIAGMDLLIGKSRVIDAHGNAHLVGFAINLTDKKEAEREMLAQLDKTSAILENSPVAIATLNTEGCIEDANYQFRKFLNCPTLGLNVRFTSLLENPYSRIIENTFHAIKINDRSYTHELVINGRIGRAIFSPYHDGFMVTISDITEDIRGQQKLRAISMAAYNSSDLIAITDETASIIFVNSAFLEHYGYEEYEVIGKNPSILKSGFHDDEFYREMYSTITRGQTWRGILHNVTKTGAPSLDDMTIIPVGDGGKAYYYVAIKSVLNG